MYYDKSENTFNVQEIVSRIDHSSLLASDHERLLAKAAFFTMYAMGPLFGPLGCKLALGQEDACKAYALLRELFGQEFLEGLFLTDPDGFFLDFGKWQKVDFGRGTFSRSPAECLTTDIFKRIRNL